MQPKIKRKKVIPSVCPKRREMEWTTASNNPTQIHIAGNKRGKMYHLTRLVFVLFLTGWPRSNMLVFFVCVCVCVCVCVFFFFFELQLLYSVASDRELPYLFSVGSDRELTYLFSVANDRELHVTFVHFACSLLRFKRGNPLNFNF